MDKTYEKKLPVSSLTISRVREQPLFTWTIYKGGYIFIKTKHKLAATMPMWFLITTVDGCVGMDIIEQS